MRQSHGIIIAGALLITALHAAATAGEVLYNPFRGKWVFGLRIGGGTVGRARAYVEHEDAAAGIRRVPGEAVPWLYADRLDPHHPDPQYAGIEPYFYVSGRMVGGAFWDGNCHTGLATLRRDGFAGMDANERGGVLTTRPLRFKGRYLFVNVDAPDGELLAEVLDGDGNVIAPYEKSRCNPVKADSTLRQVSWRGVDDLASLSGKVVHLRFHLQNGRLYAFWVSPDVSGASYGYVAAGGPGFDGPVDTKGKVVPPRP